MAHDRLLITNGSSAVELAREAGFDAVYCPWDDVIHDGPVPAGLDPTDLREVRARFIADAGWESIEEARLRFERRDHLLDGSWEEVICWFEHDLYDQLQLIQVLDRLAGRGLRVSLAQTSTFIGHFSPSEALASLHARKPVTEAQFDAARLAWHAFRRPTPVHVLEWPDTHAHPHLKAAFGRWCACFPGTKDGLSRTEWEVLDLISQGIGRPAALFQATQDREEAAFRGDTSFMRVLDGLAATPRPLIAEDGNGKLRLTEDGKRVRSGKVDAIRLRGIDRWQGGTHLTADRCWRWSAVSGRFSGSFG